MKKGKKKEEERTNRKRRKERLFVYTDVVVADDKKKNRRKQQDEIYIYMYNEGIIVASINATTKDAVTRNTDAQSMNMYTYPARRH